jgi:hypothetical protein
LSEPAPTKLPIGTRIRFLKSLYAEATGDHPRLIYARKGDGGVVTGHGSREGYWVKWDAWTSAAFGAEHGVDFLADLAGTIRPISGH